MTNPVPIPIDEDRRLAALTALDVLDTDPEDSLDDVVKFAKHAFGVSAAAISLVDRERQWFKARTGISFCETERDVAFCAHTILQPDPLIVLNAQMDERFADNRLVAGSPFIRFYAGAPLIMPGGDPVGTLCLIDSEPRFKFDEMDVQLLKFFAGIATERLIERAQLQRGGVIAA